MDQCNTCPDGQTAAVQGCLNGTEPIVIHYDYVRDVNPVSPTFGKIIGTDVRFTNALGHAINVMATDVVTAGACQ